MKDNIIGQELPEFTPVELVGYEDIEAGSLSKCHKRFSSPYDLLSPSDKKGYVRVRQATKLGYIEVKLGGGVADLSFPTSQLRRGRVQGGGQICPTLMASGSCCIYRIEKAEEDNV